MDAEPDVDETSDETLREILTRCRTVAVVGIKAGAADDAYRVPAYLQAQGYRIAPVSPKLERVLGEPVAPTLADVDGPIDLVNVFRAPQHVPAHAEEILALRPLPFAVWLQLGIRHDASADRLRAAGVRVVQDRCIRVDHRRLLGR